VLYRPVRMDRAAVVTLAIMQIRATAPYDEQMAAIEDYLRDEFSELTNCEGGHDDHR
jgi:hypothetical protein